MSRLLFTTFGSLGDLHPYIALGLEFQRRGHEVVIATSNLYRPIVEHEGLGFWPVRPAMEEPRNQGSLMKRVMDGSQGPEYLFKQVVLPHIRDTYADLFAAADGADAIVSHPLMFVVPLVARKKNIRWAYTALAPTTFLSAYDPPDLPNAAWLNNFRSLGPRFYSAVFNLARIKLNSWFGEFRALSRELGLQQYHRSPMGADQFSEHLNLALFSSVIAAPQVDWPKPTVTTGFAFYDRPTSKPGISDDLARFLDSGDPPLVFTLGSAAVMNAGNFYIESAKAALDLGKRAVLLVGADQVNRSSLPTSDTLFVEDYASYSELFPRVSAIVHQGGIGTTAQSLRAGKPMLVVPFAFDQPDNGRRAARLGVGQVLARQNYVSTKVIEALSQLTQNSYVERAKTISRIVRMENGVKVACDAVESALL